MAFKLTVTTDGGELLDEYETDCFVGAVHIAGSEEYHGVFYADCSALEVVRCLRAAMRVIEGKLQDPEILEAAQEDESELVDRTDSDDVN